MPLSNPQHRKIIHIDMDAFYASVECLNNPALKGKPLIVGAPPEARGVVASASYEARKFGIRSAMPSATALKLCPHAVIVPPGFARYRQMSNKAFEIMKRYTEIIETVALDEAWLDVSDSEQPASKIAENIRYDILNELKLTCSAGVSYNKFLAKIACGENKPNGLFVIPPKHAHSFIKTMSIKKIPGVGARTFDRLKLLGILTGGDLKTFDLDYLTGTFGKFGQTLYNRARGIDNNPVMTYRKRHSISNETTFIQDLPYGQELIANLENVVQHLWKQCLDSLTSGKTLTIKIKFSNFRSVTRSFTLPMPFANAEEINKTAQYFLKSNMENKYASLPVRLIGVKLGQLRDFSPANRQFTFSDYLQ